MSWFEVKAEGESKKAERRTKTSLGRTAGGAGGCAGGENRVRRRAVPCASARLDYEREAARQTKTREPKLGWENLLPSTKINDGKLKGV